MVVSPLGVVAGVLLIFLAPGFFLLQATFPRRRWFGPFHPAAVVVLSVALSIAITVVVGSLLGLLPGGPDDRGWFQGAQTGAPVLEASLGSVSIALFVVAWWRGAFALLPGPAGRARAAASRGAAWRERGEPEEVTRLRDLRLEEERLRKESARVRRRALQSRDPGVRLALSEAADDLAGERKDMDREAREVERRAGERRYGPGKTRTQR